MRVTVETVLSTADVGQFHPAYEAGFDAPRTRAAARHLLTEDEFNTEMTDPRIKKSDKSEMTAATLAERPDLAAQVPGLLESRWPAFLLAGRAAHGINLPELLLSHPGHQVLLINGDNDLIGAALSVPLPGEAYPTGWDGAIRAAADNTEGRTDQVCALSITVAPEATRKGLAGRLVQALKQSATQAGARRLILPVRPTRKADYPLTTMPAYLNWRTEHGEMFDPWLRLHARHGAELVGITDPATTFTGTVAEWEKWLDMPLPQSGEYVIPGGLAPLTVNLAADEGVYTESGVWMRYRL
ncbi:N-acetyltransferase family protein [Actinoplanes sp. CA-015351]|uniref:GNAT family N-acetyltransferase n=1 Tax=Actinoplanes sp. CA-015351 TaxID=3239897 RepID=UPI003D996296